MRVLLVFLIVFCFGSFSGASDCTQLLNTVPYPAQIQTDVTEVPRGFDARQLAKALDGFQFTGKSGTKYTLAAANMTSENNQVEVAVFCNKGLVCASGYRTIGAARLSTGSFSINKGLFIGILSRKFEIELINQVRNAISKPDEQFSVHSNWHKKGSTTPSLVSLGFRSLGETIQLIYDLQDDGSYQLRTKLNMDSLHPEIRIRISRILELAKMSDLIRSSIQTDKIQKAIQNKIDVENTENDGIASAVYQAYYKAVPSGTELKIEADNLETVSYFNQILTELGPAESNLKSREAALLSSAPNSKWGRILTKSGWVFTKVSGNRGTSLFSLLLVKP